MHSSATGKYFLARSFTSSNSSPLASTRRELHSFLDSNYWESFLRSEESPSFTPNPSNIKIEFYASSFEKCLSNVTSDVESTNSTEFEEGLLSFDAKELYFDIKLDPFVFPDTS